MLLASSGDMICPHIDHISGHPAICLFVCKAYMIRKGRRGKCRDQIVAEEPHEIALLFLFSSKVSISRTADGEKRVAKGRERSRSRWCTGRFCVASAPAVVEGIDAHLADKDFGRVCGGGPTARLRSPRRSHCSPSPSAPRSRGGGGRRSRPGRPRRPVPPAAPGRPLPTAPPPPAPPTALGRPPGQPRPHSLPGAASACGRPCRQRLSTGEAPPGGSSRLAAPTKW
jgi:hypothetical protein